MQTTRADAGGEGAGEERTVTAHAVVDRLNRGEVVTMRVTGGPGAEPGTTLLVGMSTADASGRATLEASVDKAPALSGYRLSLAIGGTERASVTVP